MRIVTEGLAVGHGGSPVLSGIDLAIAPGELVGLIGPNGSGKTTLLRALAGLAPPLAGTVRYDGHDAAAVGRRTLARRLGYLAQGGEVHWSQRAREVVALGRLPHRSPFAGPGPQDAEAVRRALAQADATHLAHRPVATLSGGEKARVLLARALALDGEMLLADEPVAALDPLHQLRVLELLRAAVGRGMGVVAVLHDLAQAVRFCDRVILVAGGRVAGDGPPLDVLGDAAIADAYGVRVARAVYEGAAFLLPWQPIHERRSASDDVPT